VAATNVAGLVEQFAPLARRPDWFRVPRDWVSPIGEVPAIAWDPKTGKPSVHRSMLPLLAEHPEVASILALSVGEGNANAAERAALDTRFSPFVMRGYQHTGREFILGRRGSLVADQMRLGKTFTAAAAHDPADGPLVVIGPLQAADVWATWFKRLWPDRKVAILTGRTYDPARIEGAELIFLHFAILSGWQSLIRKPPSTLIVDEAHAMANRKSALTQTVQFMMSMCERVILLTGTPLWNKPGGLYPMLSAINPGAWGTWMEFATRYCDGHPGSHGFVADGISNADELKARLTEVMICRRWTDVRAELPPVTRDVVSVPITEAQGRKVELHAEQIRVHGRARTQAGELARFRRLTGRLKVEATAAQALRVMNELGGHVIVWTWHKDVAGDIELAIHDKDTNPVFRIDGSTPNAKRVAIVEGWRNAERPSALILTMGVGQSAIDLSKARHEIFAEIDFTPATMAQAEMRPFDPNLPMWVTYLCLDHPVDRRLISVLVEKCRVAQEIGTPAADTAIDVLREAFDLTGGSGDLQELQRALLADMTQEN
jgi:SWI/SNF-related matrix-associated actin-dependent regulator 1 of chromatin subfamily A